MYTINRLQGSTLEDMLHPNFRSVNFSRNGNMMAVAHGLRSAWEGFPVTAKTKYTDDDIGAYMRSLNAGRNPWDMSEVSRELVTMDSLITPARNEDRTINTAWRSVLYEYWNHVFFDTMNFLQATAPDVGHFHPPNEEVFPITNDVVKKFNTNVMIVPGFLKERLKITMVELVDGQEKSPVTFDKAEGSDTWYDVWFLKKETEVKFNAEGEHTNELAALLILGKVCDKEHGNFSRVKDSFKISLRRDTGE